MKAARDGGSLRSLPEGRGGVGAGYRCSSLTYHRGYATLLASQPAPHGAPANVVATFSGHP